MSPVLSRSCPRSRDLLTVWHVTRFILLYLVSGDHFTVIFPEHTLNTRTQSISFEQHIGSNMPQSLADYDSQYLSSSSRRKGISFLPTSKSSRQSRHQQYQHSAASVHPLSHSEVVNPQQRHRRHESSASTVTSAATSRSSTSTSTTSHPSQGPISIREATLKAQDIRPTSDVAEWAHQMHITQGRSYWWCQGCFPREIVEPLHIPKAVEKVMTGRRVRINEPSHCYDI